MHNLSNSHIIIDPVGQRHYTVLSHRVLSDNEATAAILKKSLHRIVRSGPVAGYVGTYEFVEINAGDGWEDAE